MFTFAFMFVLSGSFPIMLLLWNLVILSSAVSCNFWIWCYFISGMMTKKQWEDLKKQDVLSEYSLVILHLWGHHNVPNSAAPLRPNQQGPLYTSHLCLLERITNLYRESDQKRQQLLKTFNIFSKWPMWHPANTLPSLMTSLSIKWPSSGPLCWKINFLHPNRMISGILFLSCLSVCLSVVNFNLHYNIWTVRDRDFIFGMHTLHALLNEP